MSTDFNTLGKDIPIGRLVPLHERKMNLAKNRGFQKILCSIKAVGLIEPLCVFEEDGNYVILDGYLRYKAAEQLGLTEIPCLVYQVKEAYTFNRMVNKLSAYQEMRMLKKARKKLDDATLAEVFGMRTIQYRLSPTLLKKLHPDVAKAFEDDLISRKCAIEFPQVKPVRQREILQEMRFNEDYSAKFLRALILKTPAGFRAPEKRQNTNWLKDKSKKSQLMAGLEEAERKHEFYNDLYQQYVTDLLKMTPYVRSIITNPKLAAYIEEHQPDTFKDFCAVVFDGSTA